MKDARGSNRDRAWWGGPSALRAIVWRGLLIALGVAYAPGAGRAVDPVTPPDGSGVAPEAQPVPDASELAVPSTGGDHYIAEIVDSLFVVGPAEFFALDLPPNPADARAVHLLGTFSVTDRKGDIQIRLFRAADYKNWLKRRGGEKADALWASKRSRNITIDQDLPQDTPLVLLLDNGYSMRTSKHVRTQLEIKYQRIPSTASSSAQGKPPDVESEGDIITPRSNTEEETPPPPPPPAPSDEGQ